MSFNYYTVEGIGVTASSIAPFVNPEKVIECIKKLYPSDLENIENDTKDINDIGELKKIVDGYICLGWYYSNICEIREQVENLINDDIYFCYVYWLFMWCVIL